MARGSQVNAIPFEHGHVVLDTSVVIKWFRQGEILARQALILRDAYLAGEAAISVPSLLVYELTNVLRYKNDLSATQVQEAVRSLFEMELRISPPDEPVMRQAIETSRTCGVTVYDGAFVALAQTTAATFVTADERLARSLAVFPFVHFLGEVQVA
jgi:predicted nucleic acid-binding protein